MSYLDSTYKKTIPEHSRISRIQRFLRSNAGFKISLILIVFVILALIEFGIILAFLLGDFLGNDFLMSYAQQRMIFLNMNESTNLWFSFGSLSLVLGVMIGIFSIKTSPQSTIQSRKRLQKYFSLILIILGILLLVLPF